MNTKISSKIILFFAISILSFYITAETSYAAEQNLQQSSSQSNFFFTYLIHPGKVFINYCYDAYAKAVLHVASYFNKNKYLVQHDDKKQDVKIQILNKGDRASHPEERSLNEDDLLSLDEINNAADKEEADQCGSDENCLWNHNFFDNLFYRQIRNLNGVNHINQESALGSSDEADKFENTASIPELQTGLGIGVSASLLNAG